MSKSQTPEEIVLAFANFAYRHGGVVTNALNNQARDMREHAAEAQATHDAITSGAVMVPTPPKLTAGQVQQLTEAADTLERVLAGNAPGDDIHDATVRLLRLVRETVLPQPRKPGTISITPHPDAWARMAGMFTESADRADKAGQAYELLADQAEDTADNL